MSTDQQLAQESIFFEHLEVDELTALIAQAKVVSLEAGDYLFRQGDKPDTVYVVLQGELEVSVHNEKHDQSLVKGSMVKGNMIGEISLLTGENRSASIRASESCRLLAFDRLQFQAVLRDNDRTRDMVRELAIQRLKSDEEAQQALDEQVEAINVAQTIAKITAILDEEFGPEAI